jgi:transposase, IS30 family
MARIGRPGLSREKRIELWARWKTGQCASDIARALEKTKGAIHHVLAFNGGIPPLARRRGPVALMLDEREEISRGIAAGQSTATPLQAMRCVVTLPASLFVEVHRLSFAL